MTSSIHHSLPKSFSRLIAVQMAFSFLFDDDFSTKSEDGSRIIKNVEENNINSRIGFFKENALSGGEEIRKIENKFVRDAIFYLQDNPEDLRTKICSYLEEDSSYRNMDNVIKTILQVAIFELSVDNTTDRNIIISQYVLIAQSYFEKNEVGFINALLDKIAK